MNECVYQQHLNIIIVRLYAFTTQMCILTQTQRVVDKQPERAGLQFKTNDLNDAE